jgi:hypothetical protein
MRGAMPLLPICFYGVDRGNFCRCLSLLLMSDILVCQCLTLALIGMPCCRRLTVAPVAMPCSRRLTSEDSR